MVCGGSHGWYPAIQISKMKDAQTIGELLNKYANDHGGKFPSGNSSTEVFQKLLDEKYVTDAFIFYTTFPGKTEPPWNQKLESKNVCWDVTIGVTSDSPDTIPLVILTGFKVNYVSGAPGTPYIKPYPKLFYMTRTIQGWWNGEPDPTPYAATVVCYKNSNPAFVKLDMAAPSYESILNLNSNSISPNFKPDGKTYRQLTPDGPLP